MTKHDSHRGESHDKPLHLVETYDHYGDHAAVTEYLAKRHGEGWENMRAGVDSTDGWPLYLNRFEALLAE